MFADDPQLAHYFGVDLIEGEHRPSYNEAPSQLVRSVQVVGGEEDEKVLDLKQWGLVPFWAKEGFKPLINARSETVTEKPSFRTAVRRRRCLIPTNGYYEWQAGPDGVKQPWFLSLADAQGNPAPPGREPLLAMAGIYENPKKNGGHKAAEGENERGPATAALLTREAADTLGEIHPRMPLFIPRPLWDLWLDPSFVAGEEIQDLVNSISTPPLAPRPVGRAVGNVRNNYPGLLDPVNLEQSDPLQGPPNTGESILF